jgi:DNA invertase Pin-like site-specific DNA recombinase
MEEWERALIESVLARAFDARRPPPPSRRRCAMAKTRAERTRWVSYLRVSTVEQAEKALSLTAQRHSAEEFAARHDAVIDHHYLEPGASGTDTHRPVFNELLGDPLAPGSTISTNVVVYHTSRFTRDATHARVVKKQLRRAGVRVLSVTQELTEDPMGTLMEGFFECIDQYESELNRLRTSAAMREAIKQGFYPGGLTPYGYCKSRSKCASGRSLGTSWRSSPPKRRSSARRTGSTSRAAAR